MLQLFSPVYPSRVYQAMQPVIKLHPDIEFRATQKLDLEPQAKGCIVLGKQMLEPFGLMGVIPKGRATTSLRGQQFTYKGVPCMFTYDAGIKDVDSGLYVDTLVDLSASVRLYRT